MPHSAWSVPHCPTLAYYMIWASLCTTLVPGYEEAPFILLHFSGPLHCHGSNLGLMIDNGVVQKDESLSAS